MFPYLLLGFLTSFYAMFLNTPKGRSFATQRTAESVVIGTLLVLAALRLVLPSRYWWRVVVAFGVGGLPMVGRSWYNRGLKN